jgi:hypothetical protein
MRLWCKNLPRRCSGIWVLQKAETRGCEQGAIDDRGRSMPVLEALPSRRNDKILACGIQLGHYPPVGHNSAASLWSRVPALVGVPSFDVDTDSCMQSTRAILEIAQAANIRSTKGNWCIIVQLASILWSQMIRVSSYAKLGLKLRLQEHEHSIVHPHPNTLLQNDQHERHDRQDRTEACQKITLVVTQYVQKLSFKALDRGCHQKR